MEMLLIRISRVCSVVVLLASVSYSAVSAGERSTKAIAGQIYLIGMNASGGSMVQSMPAETFRQNLSTVFSAVQDSLMPKLNAQREQPQISPLEMRTLGVGIGLTGQIGLGPLFQLSVGPKVRLVFSNSKNPVYPD